MSSTDASPPPAADGRPAAAPEPRRGLRDRWLGRVVLLLLVLLAALVAARSCGSADKEVTKEEAIEIAREDAPFEACHEPGCVRVHYLQRGIPVQGYWLVGLSDRPNADDEQARVRSVLIHVQTGEISPP